MFLWREESTGLTSSLSIFLRLLWRFKHLWQEGAYSKEGLLTNKMLYSNYKRSFYFPKWVAVLGSFLRWLNMYVLWLEYAQAACVCICQDQTSLCYCKWISSVSVIKSIKRLFLNWRSAPGQLFSRWSRMREETDSGCWAPLAEALGKEERLRNLLENPFFGLKLTLLLCHHPLTNHIFLMNYRWLYYSCVFQGLETWVWAWGQSEVSLPQ